ncbi:hypothetical protein HK096_002310 [Nowakowskiella sp. JEL0078]|nr:hypothetical protein HK096_002310 [Nowakowskiella sp. JEL0078]
MSSIDLNNLYLDSSKAHTLNGSSNFDIKISSKLPASLKCRVDKLTPSINSYDKYTRNLSESSVLELSVLAEAPAIEAGVIVDDDKLFYDFLGSPISPFASGDDISITIDMLPVIDENAWLSPLSIKSGNSQDHLIENINALISSEYVKDMISVTPDPAISPSSPMSFLDSNQSTISRSSESYFPAYNHASDRSFEFASKIPNKQTEFDSFDLQTSLAKISDDSHFSRVDIAGVSNWKRSIRLQNAMAVEIKKQQAENWERLQREKKEQKELKKRAAKESRKKSKSSEVQNVKFVENEIGDPNKRVAKNAQLIFSDSKIVFNSEAHDDLDLEPFLLNLHSKSENHVSSDLEEDLKVFELEECSGELNNLTGTSILETQFSKSFKETQNETEAESSSLWIRLSSLRRHEPTISAGSEPLISNVIEDKKKSYSLNQSTLESKSVWNRLPSLLQKIDINSETLNSVNDIIIKDLKIQNRTPDTPSNSESSVWNLFYSKSKPANNLKAHDLKSKKSLNELESDPNEIVSNTAEANSIHTMEQQAAVGIRFPSLRLQATQSSSSLNSENSSHEFTGLLAETPARSNTLWNRLRLGQKETMQTSQPAPPFAASPTSENPDSFMDQPNNSNEILGLETERFLCEEMINYDNGIEEEDEEGEEDFLNVLWGAVDRKDLDDILKMKGWRLCPGCRYIHRTHRIPNPVRLDSIKSVSRKSSWGISAFLRKPDQSDSHQSSSFEESLALRYPHAVICRHCNTVICFKCGSVLTKGEVLSAIVDLTMEVEEELKAELQQKASLFRGEKNVKMDLDEREKVRYWRIREANELRVACVVHYDDADKACGD